MDHQHLNNNMYHELFVDYQVLIDNTTELFSEHHLVATMKKVEIDGVGELRFFKNNYFRTEDLCKILDYEYCGLMKNIPIEFQPSFDGVFYINKESVFYLLSLQKADGKENPKAEIFLRWFDNKYHLNTKTFIKIFVENYNYAKNKGDEFDIKVIETIDTPWFHAKDFLKILDYADSSIDKKISKIIEKCEIQVFRKKCVKSIIPKKHKNKQDKYKNIFISQKELIFLLNTSRKINKEKAVLWFQKKFDLNLNLVNITHEQRTIGPIKKSLDKRYKTVSEYRIGKYRIDLYIPEIKLAIECDENDHADRDPVRERTRKRFIEQTLNCHFIRYNPNDSQFDIFDVWEEIKEYEKYFHAKNINIIFLPD